jgi:beta-glucosidase
MRRTAALVAAAAATAATTIAAAARGGASAARPWLTPGQPIAARVASLLAEMTLEEKAMQLNYNCDATRFNWSAAPWASTSIGSVGIECSTPPADPCDMACRIAALREYQLGALNSSRLGIPVTFVIETSHCGAAGGTIFPMGVTQGASWNVSLVREVAAAIAVEARAWGGSRGLSPEINVVTDPRFGRTEENFGEEPLLVARMAAAATLGLQGSGMPTDYLASYDDNIVAEAKHCCAYGFSGLDGGAADVSEATLRNVFVRARVCVGGCVGLGTVGLCWICPLIRALQSVCFCFSTLLQCVLEHVKKYQGT